MSRIPYGRKAIPNVTELSAKKLIILCGAGGVGKTTLAASVALHLAEQGHRTLVLTVDPAKRLAQALGFKEFDQEIQPVSLPFAPKAVLYGSMLDSSRYFDRMMERFAKSEEQKKKILNHPLYQLTVAHLGGTQEYAAMERILEFCEDPRFDRIVVDTPPTANAMDLFTAPKRMAEFMDGQVIRWFRQENGGAFSFLKQGTKIAMKLLQKVFGGSFFEQLADLLSHINGMETGFIERHEKVMKLLAHPSTDLFLVSLPNETRFQECVGFQTALREYGIRIKAIVLNQVAQSSPEQTAHWKQEIAQWPSDVQVDWQRFIALNENLAEAHRFWTHRFTDRFQPLKIFKIVKRGTRVTDLNELRILAQQLSAAI